IDQGKPAANDADARDAVYYFHNDVSGLPEELTDAGGDLVWQARYKVWGNAVQEEWVAREPQRSTPAWGEVQETAPVSVRAPRSQNLRFQGEYLDRETGLHYNLFRYYDPDVGRFITPDPIGLSGGLNLYQYARNPISWIDPWGLTCTKAFNKRNNIAERWVDRLTGKKPQDVESFLTDKGFTKSITNQNSPKTSHTLFTRTTGNGDVDVLDFHPGGGVHGSEYWKVYRNGEVQGRIGPSEFQNFDRIFDSPVYVDGNLSNSPK
ncbi:hypothetical protein DF045_27795, partial [Burkholderia cepacia]